MAAEVCLLLMQSLTGECHVELPEMESSIPQVEEPTNREQAAIAATADEAIAPASTPAEPQFGNRCDGENASRLVVCALPAKARENWTAPSSSMAMPTVAPSATSNAPAPVTMTATASAAPPQPAIAATTPTSLTTPVALEIPRSRRSVPLPSVQAPQFSTAPALAAVPSLPTNYAQQRPTSGAQLYRQRQLALQSGRSYTRLSPNTYVDQWSRASRQPTYQEWQNLLTQEARAIAGGQGQNRLEVVVGDSIGLWLPPEMLPGDRLWLNQSISGDTTAGILRRLSTFATTRPTTIHLMAGTNDLKNGVPEDQILRNLQQTVSQLQRQHPQARIVVYSVLPTRRADITNDRVRSLNARIATLTQRSAAEYRDIHAWFQDPQGHLRRDLTTDGLHLNPHGYALWQRAILARAW